MKKSLVLTKIVTGVKKPDIGRTITLKDVAGNLIATATETPASSGVYEVNYTATAKYGYWYVDGTIKDAYGNNTPFWLGEYNDISGSAITASTITASTISSSIINATTITSFGTIISPIISASISILTSAVTASFVTASQGYFTQAVTSSIFSASVSVKTSDITASAITASSIIAANITSSFISASSIWANAVTSSNVLIGTNSVNTASLYISGTNTRNLIEVSNFQKTKVFVMNRTGSLTLSGSLSQTGGGVSFNGVTIDTLGNIGMLPYTEIGTYEDGDIILFAWSKAAQITLGDGTIAYGSYPGVVHTYHGNINLSVASHNPYLASTNYASGFAGSGFKIDHGNTYSSKSAAEVDNLTVRGRMNIYELVINQIRATNGSIWVSDSGKVNSVVAGGEGGIYVTMSFDTGSTVSEVGHGFAVNDIIRAQRWDAKHTSSIFSEVLVDAVVDTRQIYGTVYSQSGAPVAGYEYVRIGNTTDTSRQGAIYLTSTDSGAPFIDIVDGLNSTSSLNTAGKIKSRLGKLTGITSPKFGALSGYGLYASGSAYLEGAINADRGYIGGFAITKDAITGSSFFISGAATGNQFFISSSNFNVRANGVMTASNANFQTAGSGQRVVIDSTNGGQLKFYNAANINTMLVGDSIYGSSDGLRILNGVIRLTYSGSGQQNTIDLGNGGNSAAVVSSTVGSPAGGLIGLKGIAGSVDANAGGGQSDTYGIWGESLHESTSSIAKAVGVYGKGGKGGSQANTSTYGGYFEGASANGNGYGIYATAYSSSVNYAGYFDNGNVLIKNSLTVSGSLAVVGNITAAGNNVTRWLGAHDTGASGQEVLPALLNGDMYYETSEDGNYGTTSGVWLYVNVTYGWKKLTA